MGFRLNKYYVALLMVICAICASSFMVHKAYKEEKQHALDLNNFAVDLEKRENVAESKGLISVEGVEDDYIYVNMDSTDEHLIKAVFRNYVCDFKSAFGFRNIENIILENGELSISILANKDNKDFDELELYFISEILKTAIESKVPISIQDIRYKDSEEITKVFVKPYKWLGVGSMTVSINYVDYDDLYGNVIDNIKTYKFSKKLLGSINFENISMEQVAKNYLSGKYTEN